MQETKGIEHSIFSRIFRDYTLNSVRILMKDEDIVRLGKKLLRFLIP